MRASLTFVYADRSRMRLLAFALVLAAPAAAQPVLLADIASGGAGSGIAQIEPFGPWAYFGACSTSRCDLWRTDGAAASRVRNSVAPAALGVGGAWLYVIDTDGGATRLARTDGSRYEAVRTPQGEIDAVTLGAALPPGQKSDVFFFSARDALGVEPWVTQPGGLTLRVADLNPAGDSDPQHFETVGDAVLFWADGGAATGRELYRTTGASTQPLADLNPGPEGAFVHGRTARLGGWLYLVADDGQAGPELWRSDGAALELVADLRPGPEGSAPGYLAAAGGWVYVDADDGTEGREIWRTDGTTTERVSDFAPGPDGAAVVGMRALGDAVYTAADAGLGAELYRTDGAATALVADLAPGPESAFPDGLDADTLGGALYLRGRRPDWGTELFRVTESGGLVLAADLAPGPASSAPAFLTAVGERLVFVADDGTTGAEPYAYAPSAPIGTEAQGGEAVALRVAPHPVRDRGAVFVGVRAPGPVRLALRDVRGREVARLHDGPMGAGEHRLSLPSGLAPGVYLLVARAQGAVQTRRVVVAR